MGVSLESLRRFEVPGKVQVEAGEGGLLRLNIRTALAQAQVYLHGAHLTHWQPAGHAPVLFLSEQSLYAPGKAIRGGVPVIFPWFGPHGTEPGLPAHGLVRTREWELEGVERWTDDTIEIVLRFFSTEETLAVWPHDFVLRHRIIVGRQLEMRLEVENWSAEPFRFEEALHTYLAVRDIRQVPVHGLEGVEYLDKTAGYARKRQEGPIEFSGETDRMYLGTEGACLAVDEPGGRTLRVSKEGSRTTVVWNPWHEKTAALADLGDEEWPHLLCVETVNANTDAVTLAPRETHVMRAVISVESAK